MHKLLYGNKLQVGDYVLYKITSIRVPVYICELVQYNHGTVTISPFDKVIQIMENYRVVIDVLFLLLSQGKTKYLLNMV